MEQILYILAKSVEIYLGIASLAMIMRMLLPIFMAEDNRFLIVCHIVSEPVILPFRFLMSKFGIGENSIIDMPFFVAYLALMAIRIFLPAI